MRIEKSFFILGNGLVGSKRKTMKPSERVSLSKFSVMLWNLPIHQEGNERAKETLLTSISYLYSLSL